MTVEIELNDWALARLKKMAEERHVTVEKVLQEILQRSLESQAFEDPILGMFAQEPELMDDVVAEAMKARESDPLRQRDG
jgi:hypothetical protein